MEPIGVYRCRSILRDLWKLWSPWMSWYLVKPLKTTKLAKTSKAFDGTPVQCLGTGLDQICFYRISTVVLAIVFQYFQSVSFCHFFTRLGYI